MAMNPMQRKANNSFLLGVVITILITGAIIAFLIFQLANLNKEMEESQANKVYGYVVIGTIKSGTEITAANLRAVEMNIDGSTSTIYSSQNGMPFPTGLKAKVDLNPGTIVTSDLTYEDEALGNDVRSQEYNVIQLTSQLQTGDYIDVRLRTPDGRDLIVISHKEVTIPTILGVDSTNCIWMDLTEEETLLMSCAIVESYQMNGAKLYTAKYVEPGIQNAATPTYEPNDETITLINNDPNIVQEAKNELITRYNANRDTIRPGIDSATGHEDAQDNVVEKTEEEITSLQEERELYIGSLAG